MNDMYAGYDDVKRELDFLTENFHVEFHYVSGDLKTIGLAYSQSKRMKQLGISRKTIIDLLDWLESKKDVVMQILEDNK